MLKKYTLIGVLVTLATLVGSAFTTVDYKPVANNAVSIAMASYSPRHYDQNTRATSVTSSGNSQLDNFYSLSIAAIVLQGPHYFQYGPGTSLNSFRTSAKEYFYSPSIAAIVSQGPHYYQYGPAITASGFGANLRLYQQRYTSPSTGFGTSPMDYFYSPTIAEIVFPSAGSQR
jgi:hypothetical protein